MIKSSIRQTRQQHQISSTCISPLVLFSLLYCAFHQTHHVSAVSGIIVKKTNSNIVLVGKKKS